MRVDRRLSPRWVCASDCWIRIRPAVVARIVDLGARGALVETTSRFIPGSMTSVVFDSEDVPSAVRARISRCFIAAFSRLAAGETLPVYRTALEFVASSAGEATTLEMFVSALTARGQLRPVTWTSSPETMLPAGTLATP